MKTTKPKCCTLDEVLSVTLFVNYCSFNEEKEEIGNKQVIDIFNINMEAEDHRRTTKQRPRILLTAIFRQPHKIAIMLLH